MDKGTLFWVLWLIALIFGLSLSAGLVTFTWAPVGGSLMVFVLLGLLGWHCFGPAVK